MRAGVLMMRPFNIMSLWDVLQIDVHHLLASLSHLASSQKYFAILRRNLIETGNYGAEETEKFVHICAAAMRLKAIADKLEMPAASGAAQRVIEHADDLGPQAALFSADQVAGLVNEISSLISCFHDEMQARLLFVIPAGHAKFYTSDEPLFGPDVEQAFPSASAEISEAGKCRALARWTACVMHLMRALEPALMALQAAVQVNVPKEQWGHVLDQIEAKIREIRKASHGKVDEQWYSEAASHFRFIKDGWRNYSQHLHERYDEERAVVIYDSVRAFMRHLATRLTE